MDFRGNRWYKCDLHLHTPESICFSDKDVTPKEWVEACINKGLDVVAVTDHNSGNYIDKVLEEAEGTGLTVFPGVEITCDSAKVHLLILFDKHKRTSDINGFLQYCGIEEHKFAQQDATTSERENIFTVAEKASERGALVIAAHIDEYNGISEMSYQKMSDFLDKNYINGVQVVNGELLDQTEVSTPDLLESLKTRYSRIDVNLLREWKNAVKLSLEKNKAILTFSDNPSGQGQTTHGLWGIGNRYTWIKMKEEVTLESLRHALLMPRQKIKNDFQSKSIPYATPDLTIKGLEIKNSNLNSEKPLEIHFNPQMNTIIGGRGTGKSSINRIIRGLLGGNSELNDFNELLKEQTDFFKVNESVRGEESKGVLKAETEIDLYLQRLGRTYKINYINFNGVECDKSFYVLNDFDEYEVCDSSILELFQAEIYSQKQIYNIASRPNALREKIDQSIDGFNEHKNMIDAIKNKYFEITARMRTIEKRLENKSRLEIDINDMKERLKEFEEKGYQSTLKKQEEAEIENSQLQSVINDLDRKKETLSDFQKEFSYPDISKFNYNSKSAANLKQILEDNYQQFQEVIAKLEEGKTILATVQTSLKDAIASSAWQLHLKEVKVEYENLQERLGPEDLSDLSNIESLSNRLSQKEKEMAELMDDEIKLNDLSKELEELISEYLEIRKMVTLRRREFLKDTLADISNINISVSPFRDIINYEDELRKILQRAEAFTEDFQKVNSIIFSGQVERTIKAFSESIVSIKYDGIIDNRFSRRFNTFIQNLSDEQIDKIKLLYPEDKIEVQYKSNEASPFKSISNASAGQKTSAILTFLLSYGNSPLLLDQPEDDLDNQLIYDLIVNRLSHSKNHRQIITVTHNANIPVNGDSEWVIAMNSESKDIEVMHEGSIEDQNVKEAICNIMEGGREAFELRAKRYNLNA
ncbi:TrlF family AAA-like ATPase [Jeotgalibacillus terrae]|uniref:TrlF family AAA-like ATPase n=1 Tax=Jeotgalibacillus terrae TaxID=587735 RepID=A0ABW5ZN92_9BACL|nr:PHP domain-containing protein [Jeotgalibacillus terrae]MBM7581036.1 energy-coupling factor transporter ATP-binding protein EcfA2 [Jeotgalibacillus terrae]